MKIVLSFLVLLAASVICSPDAFGQAYMQAYLPEGAKARIGKGRVHELAYSPDSTKLAVASTIGIWLYDAQTGEALKLLTGHTDSVRAICFNRDGSTLASGSHDATIRLWDVRTGVPTVTLEGHTGNVYSVVFSPDGRTLASGSSDKTIRLWDSRTGELKATLTGHTAGVYSVAFSPDGQSLASGSWDEFIKFWDVDTGELLRTIAGHAVSVSVVVYSPDGETLASYGGDGRIHVWAAKTGEFLRTLKPDRPSSIAYSPDSATLACGRSDDTIQLWDIHTGQPKSTLAGHPGAGMATDAHLKTFNGPTNWVTSVVFSPNGDTLASSSYDGTIRFWDTATGISQHIVTGHTTGLVRSVMYSSHGCIFACARMGSIQLWEPHTGSLIKAVNWDVNRTTCTAYSPDNVTFACGNYDIVWLLDANTDEHNETALIPN